MSLQAELDGLKARFLAKAPQETVAIMERAIEGLRRSGILAGVVKVGDRMPEFTLPDTAARPVSSRELLARGPLVVSFYRGKW